MSNEELLRLCTFNCRGLGQHSKRRTVFHWLKKQYNGIIFLQETHCTEALISQWEKDWKGQIYFSNGSSTSRGVATLFSDNLDISVNNIIRDDYGRFLLIDATFDGQQLILANVYAPTEDDTTAQCNFLDYINETLIHFVDKNILLGGDFNICLDPNMDKKGGTLENVSRSADKLNTLQEAINLLDVWRFLNPLSRRYTRREMSRAGLVQSRLDYWLVSNHILYDFHSQDIHPGLKSDHSLVSLKLKIRCTQQKGRGFFKFNSALLKDLNYVNRVKELISDFKVTNGQEQNKGLYWDTLKAELRGFTISYASGKAKERRAYEDSLKKQLQQLEKQLTSDKYTEYKTVKNELEELNKEYMLGAQLRSKAKYTEETEQNVSYFLKEETKNYNMRYIRTLYNEENILVTDPNSILSEQEKFYKNLYAKRDTDIDMTIFEGTDLPKLSDKSVEICDEVITLQEVGRALKELPNKKTPGTDGFTADFYKFFWPNIKDIVFESLTYAFDNNTLSIEQKRGILSIIPKKGKDLRRLKNWRPLSLLNTDYKILTKLLASRLQKVISEIVSLDQSGYIKGRYIGDNIRNIYDAIQYTAISNIPGMIVALDFEKAFDSISWDFLFQTLEYFNFGPNFIDWIRLIYAEPECCVTNNGYHSTFFKLGRGIRQGCPISALLFILAVEVMASNIRTNQEIKGIPLSNSENLVISQLADDTTLFLSDVDSLNKTLEFIKAFGRSSGLMLNKDKSEAFWIGSMLHSQNKPCGLKWTTEYIKCLGIWCGPDIEGAINKNYTEKLSSLEKVINMWSRRNLSIKGKIAVLRSLILPQILYPATVLYVPDKVIDEVEHLFFRYVWPNKVHVKREVIVKEIAKGGLKMPLFSSIVKAVKCTWVQRLVKRNPSRNILLEHLVKYKKLNFQNICYSKLDVKHVHFDSLFYKQVLEHWYSIFSREPSTIKQIINSMLWDNIHICVDDKPVHYSNWIANNILTFSHIMDDDGNILNRAQIEHKYNIIVNWMDYNSLIHAIPRSWKQKVKGQDVQCYLQTDYCKMVFIQDIAHNISTLRCKDFYWEFISLIDSVPCSELKWSEYFGLNVINWEDYYVIPYNVCRETFLQSFQYKIQHRYYPCNYTLSIWYVAHSSKCDICDAVDNLEHFFFYCQTVRALWSMIIVWWRNIIGFSINISSFDVLFGIPNENGDKSIDFMNLSILYGKYYIHMCKKNNSQIFFMDYIKYVKDRLEIEKMYCQINQLDTFEKRWAEYFDQL